MTSAKYNVVEIFDSIEGEGKRSGSLATFIRFAGCNLRCSYCDTSYALFGEKQPCHFERLTLDSLLEKVHHYQVTLTGGEPLLQPSICSLIQRLDEAHEINIETNGAVDIRPVRNTSPSRHLFFTIDYKLPSSGMEKHMIRDNFENLRKEDVVKFVIGSYDDEIRTLEIADWLEEYYDKENLPQIYLGTVNGKWENERIVELMKKTPSLNKAHIQLQLHKIIWDENKRGV